MIHPLFGPIVALSIAFVAVLAFNVLLFRSIRRSDRQARKHVVVWERDGS